MSSVKVFIAGSRAVTRLNDEIRKRLDNVMAEAHEVIVGDANGADRIVQKYLADHHYSRVSVYCTGGRCRNNVAGWQVVAVAAPPGARGFDFYSAKDQRMAADATHGLMLWDGDSRGTFANIKNLVAAQKPVVVYLSPAKRFMNVRTRSDVDELIGRTGSFELSEAGRHV